MTHLLCLLCFLFSSGNIYSQVKPKPNAKQAVPELKKILSGTGLPFNIVNDSLAIIPYEGENIKSYNVVVQKISDLYIVYTSLTEILPEKIDDTKYKYLLERNHNFDIVKIGINEEDNTVYLRADVYKSSTTSTLLTRVIRQVANVTNIIAGNLK